MTEEAMGGKERGGKGGGRGEGRQRSLLAVSDSGRILLYRGDGSFARVISSGYLNAALAFDGKRILVGGANSKVSSAGEGLEDSEKLQVWHLFKLPEFGGKIIA
eukprot:746073-Hanusia_phi.AAC.5